MIWRQKQHGGDGSTNIQANIAQFGVSYSDAREIALDVFRENFAKLSQGAYRKAHERAEELTENYLSEIRERSPESIRNIEDPGIQADILEAQSGYAKSGDQDLGEILVDLLVDRSAESTRTIRSLALSAAISTAQKLTASHFAALSALFVVKQVRFGGIDLGDLESLHKHLSAYLTPLSAAVQGLTETDVQYLTGLGCLTISVSSSPVAHRLRNTYPGLFTRGFEAIQFPDIADLIGTEMVTTCGRNPERYQINATDIETLRARARDMRLSDEQVDRLYEVMITTPIPDADVIDELTQYDPDLKKLLDVFEKCELPRCTNTAIGTTIAHANLRRVTSGSFDGAWDLWLS
ncbi:LPO_1073/Vpar_1526 family protein [Streptomyces sp. NPDC048330]|uniref:LPO_1073/Vpar_1526 family protein n=1 Tax=Streptomyces sp. NPDC048330 TaxID=3365533 RepID=UPI00371AF2B0